MGAAASSRQPETTTSVFKGSQVLVLIKADCSGLSDCCEAIKEQGEGISRHRVLQPVGENEPPSRMHYRITSMFCQLWAFSASHSKLYETELKWARPTRRLSNVNRGPIGDISRPSSNHIATSTPDFPEGRRKATNRGQLQINDSSTHRVAPRPATRWTRLLYPPQPVPCPGDPKTTRQTPHPLQSCRRCLRLLDCLGK